MLISICIPQYNRIELLLSCLTKIEEQNYSMIEICISDDGSTDDTFIKLEELKNSYRYPIRTHYFKENQGYDRNYRKCIEMASGDYALVLGNDDSLYYPDAVKDIVSFVTSNDLPDIGYTNYVEDKDHSREVKRARKSQVIGSGIDVAISHYRGFSFVGGLIYKTETFNRFNTNKHDGSVFSQLYLGLLMIASGCRLFTINKPVVLKDVLNADGSFRWSFYRDGLPKSFKDYKEMDGGLPSVTYVLGQAIIDSSGSLKPGQAYKILRRVYTVTLPYWIIKYKQYGSFAAALGLAKGCTPFKHQIFSSLSLLGKGQILLFYLFTSFMAIVMPWSLFNKIEASLHNVFGRK